MKADLGTRRRAYRERMRAEHPMEHVTEATEKHSRILGWAFASFLVGCLVASVWLLPLGPRLVALYCTPVFCPYLPQALTGWALAVVPVALVYYGLKEMLPRFLLILGAHLSFFLAGFMGVFFYTGNADVPYELNPNHNLWVLSLTYFVVGLLIVPLGRGVAGIVIRRGKSKRWIDEARAVVIAVFHFAVLAVLIVWTA